MDVVLNFLSRAHEIESSMSNHLPSTSHMSQHERHLRTSFTETSNSEPTSLLSASHNMAPSHSASTPFFLESKAQTQNDFLLFVAFLITTLIAAKRMHYSRTQGGIETTVVTAFYSLILVTSVLRTVWFGIPSHILEPSYVPSPVTAFEGQWLGTFVSELLLSFGSLSLFSIFILILVYWSDILKKYFQPSSRRQKPMSTFLTLVGFLFLIQSANCSLFLLKFYTSEMMILVDSLTLAILSLICILEITLFSAKFRTVLRTLGAINQVSTESQVKRIVWITVTGNLFFVCRVAVEVGGAGVLVMYYNKHHAFEVGKDLPFTEYQWTMYLLVKHWSEVCILCLMLYILQSRFTTAGAQTGGGGGGGGGARKSGGGNHPYEPVPDAKVGGKGSAIAPVDV